MSTSKAYYDGDIRRRIMPAERRKAYISMRHNEWDRESHPQIDVKVYDSFEPVIERVMREFHVADDVARNAVQAAFECQQWDFWDYWQNEHKEYDERLSFFPDHDVTVHCEGRSGGHLVVKGLPDVRSWDAVMVARWWRFADAVAQDIEYRISADALIECIEANDYATPMPLRCLQEVA